MKNEAQIKSVALFFSLALLEDQLARQATFTTLYRLKKILEKETIEGFALEVLIVKQTNKFWLRYQKYLSKDEGYYSGGLNTLDSNFTDVGPWREFRRMAEDDEFLAVLWSQIIGLKINAISQGLGTTDGTVKHRISRGLRYLGERMI